MTRITTIFTVFFLAFLAIQWAGAQGKTNEPIRIEASAISQGEIKTVEPLMTRDGDRLEPGVYHVAVTLTTSGEVRFIISKSGGDAPAISSPAARANAEPERKLTLPGDLLKNNLVKGLASVKGDFKVEPFSPSEALLSFTSKQFEAQTVLGRLKDSKVADMTPLSAEIKEGAPCGQDCFEAIVVVTVKNDGNSVARGKWNVSLQQPAAYIGSVENLAGGATSTVTSPGKIRFGGGAYVQLDVKVYPDFYNRDANDANDSNNTKRFSLKTSTP